jgi:hypothetical protein
MFPYHTFSCPWYFSSWTNGEPHHSGFKSQTAALSLWCVMFLVWRFFCRESVECCPGIVSRYFLTFTYNYRGPNDYRYDKAFHVPHSLNFYT